MRVIVIIEMIPVMGPEGIIHVAPRSGFNLALSMKDRVRWANIFQSLRRKGMTIEKAEIQAFLQVYQLKDPHLTYSLF
jgi:hypothetical protein